MAVFYLILFLVAEWLATVDDPKNKTPKMDFVKRHRLKEG